MAFQWHSSVHWANVLWLRVREYEISIKAHSFKNIVRLPFAQTQSNVAACPLLTVGCSTSIRRGQIQVSTVIKRPIFSIFLTEDPHTSHVRDRYGTILRIKTLDIYSDFIPEVLYAIRFYIELAVRAPNCIHNKFGHKMLNTGLVWITSYEWLIICMRTRYRENRVTKYLVVISTIIGFRK